MDNDIRFIYYCNDNLLLMNYSIKELQAMNDGQQMVLDSYRSDLLNILRNDPSASEDDINYSSLDEYLQEIQHTDKSLLYHIICALEHYLDK